MKLLNVYESRPAVEMLYALLKQRDNSHSISHQQLPAFEEHCAFVASSPYRFWYLVEAEGLVCGSAYITENNEVGLFLNPSSLHLQSETLQLIVTAHTPLPAIKSKRVAAFSINANPANAVLIAAIESVGGQHVQNTYILKAG